MFKKLIASLLIFSFLGSQPAYCFVLEDVYKVKNASKEDITKNIDNYIDRKKHKVHRKDLNNGYFYIRPRHMGTLLGEKDYLVAKVAEYEGNTVLFLRNDFSSDRIHKLILNNLKDSGYEYEEIDNDDLEDEYLEDTSNFIATYNKTNHLFNSYKTINTEDFKFSESQELPENIKLSVYKKIFNSNLNEKFAGYTFNIKNKNKFPVVITDLYIYNNFDDKEAFKKVKKTTWQSYTISFLAGLFAFPTFGISLAALPLAAGFDIKENLPVKKESEKFLQEQAETNYLKENQSVDVRVISTKSDSIVTKRPYIKVNFVVPENKEMFTVDTRAKKGNKKWEEML